MEFAVEVTAGGRCEALVSGSFLSCFLCCLLLVPVIDFSSSLQDLSEAW